MEVIEVVFYSRWSLNAGSIRGVVSKQRSLKAVDCLIKVVSNTVTDLIVTLYTNLNDPENIEGKQEDAGNQHFFLFP